MAKIGEMIQTPTIGQIMARAAAEQNWFKEQMAETGHETNTMLWNDFTIADYYGIKSVMDTYNKALNASKSYDAEKKKNKYNEKVIAELYIVLNWKIWALYEKTIHWHGTTTTFGKSATTLRQNTSTKNNSHTSTERPTDIRGTMSATKPPPRRGRLSVYTPHPHSNEYRSHI